MERPMTRIEQIRTRFRQEAKPGDYVMDSDIEALLRVVEAAKTYAGWQTDEKLTALCDALREFEKGGSE